MRRGFYTTATKVRIFIDFDWREWVLPIAAALLAEIWLAGREKRWPGLVLPGLAFLWGTGKTMHFCAGAGNLLRANGALLGAGLQYFALCQIPAVLLLAVYAVCREYRRRKRRREQEKMHIDDL